VRRYQKHPRNGLLILAIMRIKVFQRQQMMLGIKILKIQETSRQIRKIQTQMEGMKTT